MKHLFFKIILLGICLISARSAAYAQIDKQSLNGIYNNLSWDNFVDKIESDFQLRIFYPADSLSHLVFHCDNTEFTALKSIEEFLKPKKYQVSTDGSNIFITKNIPIYSRLPDNFFQSRYYRFPDSDGIESSNYLSDSEEYIPRVEYVGSRNADRKTHAVFSGYVINRHDESPLAGAVLLIKETGQTTVTNSAGYFSLTLRKGTYILQVTSIEVEPASIELHVLSDGKLNIELNRRYVAIDEVTVSSEVFHNVRSTNLGFERISTRQTEEIPSAIGENDIVQVGLLLPGVQSVGEGASGINVRGSPTDQNMFYLDKLPIYNTSHFLGFFSSFNAAAIDEFTLYKSSIPAEYNGSLASVAEIKAKDGDKNRFSASGGISPISTNIQAEGPIFKDKASYMVSLRSSYSNWILDLIENPVLNKSSASFQDFIGKFSFELDKNNKLRLLSYYSSDYTNLAEINIYDYQTIGGGLEWHRIIANKHSLTTNLVHSNYGFTEQNYDNALYAYQLPYTLKHTEISSRLNINLNEQHRLRVGLSSILYSADRGGTSPISPESVIARQNIIKENALLTSIYVGDQWKATDNLTINSSIRFNQYNFLGPATVYSYAENSPYTEDAIQDTTRYENFERVKSYLQPDFRLSFNYTMNNFSVKGGFSYLHQYIFMMSNTIAAAPVNVWKLSDAHLKPISGTQYSAGFYGNLLNSRLELSAEVYYKNIANFKDYKEGANIKFSQIAELDLLEGKLNSYGIEFMIKKRGGRLNGWVNYSYSNATVQTDSPFREQQANRGKPYPANYDKPHAFNFVGNYKFGRRFSMSSNIVYSTGRPITYPVGVYYLDDTQLLNYSGRNEYRISDYFRIDLSLKMEGSLRVNKKAHGTWVASVYNLTGRSNAYSVFFRSEEGTINSYQMSIFAVPVFTLSYQFKLGNYADKHF